MTLRRCVDEICKPIQSACQKDAKNDGDRLVCEERMIGCMSQCRLAIKTGLPLPEMPGSQSN